MGKGGGSSESKMKDEEALVRQTHYCSFGKSEVTGQLTSGASQREPARFLRPEGTCLEIPCNSAAQPEAPPQSLCARFCLQAPFPHSSEIPGSRGHARVRPALQCPAECPAWAGHSGSFVVSHTLCTLPTLGQQPHVWGSMAPLHSSPGLLATLVGLEN